MELNSWVASRSCPVAFSSPSICSSSLDTLLCSLLLSAEDRATACGVAGAAGSQLRPSPAARSWKELQEPLSAFGKAGQESLWPGTGLPVSRSWSLVLFAEMTFLIMFSAPVVVGHFFASLMSSPASMVSSFVSMLSIRFTSLSTSSVVFLLMSRMPRTCALMNLRMSTTSFTVALFSPRSCIMVSTNSLNLSVLLSWAGSPSESVLSKMKSTKSTMPMTSTPTLFCSSSTASRLSLETCEFLSSPRNSSLATVPSSFSSSVFMTFSRVSSTISRSMRSLSFSATRLTTSQRTPISMLVTISAAQRTKSRKTNQIMTLHS
mmetsp:Transcript_41561/g.108170  ORF Transcript_41561/g.108170 Transcript_41561/m.108170 type:complete len:320 (-) Transcript_41561:890-1849(-)